MRKNAHRLDPLDLSVFWTVPVALFALLSALSIICLIYWPGVTAPFHFDDAPNLRGLASLSGDLESRMLFVFGGVAGPTGRPVSLASFLVDGAAWPHDSSVFIRTNILLHLINSCLVLWIGFLIAKAGRHSSNAAFWVGTLAALLWATSPLLQSATFMIIQRMTTLSALFVFAGLVSHLKLREMDSLDQSWKLLFLGLSIVVFTGLATLSKENGALLPVLVLILEWTLLKRPRGIVHRDWTIWKAVFLALPAGLLAAFLIYSAGYSEANLLRRGFDSTDRLATQVIILWEYLAAAVSLNPQFFNPYLDNYPVSRSFLMFQSLVAASAWIATLILAILVRSRLAPLTLAILWYLVGHSVESTTAPLELVFQHRNYVPLLGFALAIPLLILKLRGVWRALLIGLALIVLSVNISQSWRMAAIWGDTDRAARHWLERNPGSRRATSVMLARLIETDRIAEALDFAQAVERASQPENRAVYQLMRLRFLCRFDEYQPEQGHPSLAEVEQSLRVAAFSFVLSESLRAFNNEAASDQCPWLDDAAVDRLLRAALDNPALKANDHTRYFLSRSIAILAARNADWARAIDFYESAVEAYSDPAILQQLTIIHSRQESFRAGCAYLEAVHDRGLKRPLYWRNWQLQVRALHAHLSRLAMEAGQDCEPFRI